MLNARYCVTIVELLPNTRNQSTWFVDLFIRCGMSCPNNNNNSTQVVPKHFFFIMYLKF